LRKYHNSKKPRARLELRSTNTKKNSPPLPSGGVFFTQMDMYRLHALQCSLRWEPSANKPTKNNYIWVR
jgi:hypothetical protein